MILNSFSARPGNSRHTSRSISSGRSFKYLSSSTKDKFTISTFRINLFHLTNVLQQHIFPSVRIRKWKPVRNKHDFFHRFSHPL